MKLYKFCNAEHNVSKGAKIRLGSLHSYRSIENDYLRDESEGKYSFYIDFPDLITLDRRWMNFLFQGALAIGDPLPMPRFPGSTNVGFDTLTIVKHDNQSVTVKNTRVVIHREVPDALIFCMSMMNEAADCPFPNYEDRWEIPFESAGNFSVRLADLIYHQMPISELTPSIVDTHSLALIKNISIEIKHRPVIYGERRLIVRPNGIPSIDSLVEKMGDIAFIKPEKFSNEKEYRFSFTMIDNQRQYAPRQSGILLNPNFEGVRNFV
jgi:hypothetical protein